MLTEPSIDIIERWRLGFVASADPTGFPNLSPKGTFRVINETTIAFGDIRSPGTISNIATRADVEINFVDVLSRRGIRIRGTARHAPRDTDEFAAQIEGFRTIWGEELCAKFRGIVFVDVQSVKPLITPAYDIGSSEEELRAQWMGIIKTNQAEALSKAPS